VGALLFGLALVTGGCGRSDDAGQPSRFEPAPATVTGPLDDRVVAAVERLFANVEGYFDTTAVGEIGESGDARMAWFVSDLLRFFHDEISEAAMVEVFETLTRVKLTRAELEHPWVAMTDRLLAWDLPAPPGYVGYKARLFELVEPDWAPFFSDPGAAIDWRRVTWGGVLMDSRPYGDPSPCPEGCIPALDRPGVTDAAGGAWYSDGGLVFGVRVNGAARAYPKNVMQVHEMVNDMLGGRRIGIPYCTLCDSAQAYFTDRGGDGPIVLRTSGLLVRSNKVMVDLRTRSILDTFTGRALTGPLRRRGVALEQIPVVTTTWGAWKAAHPETTIVARDGGIGRTYPEDPLHGRDLSGPIFPVGNVDPRLPAQRQVLGVIAPDGTPLAFPVEAATAALRAGRAVRLAGVQLALDGGGLVATLAGGGVAVSHQAFWFAWSQFHPGTVVWTVANER
jgi:hypothetical protein